MGDYYDPNALVDLDRHLALVGLVTADTRRVGSRVASLTGLQLIDLERLVEHEAGMSIWELISTEGPLYFRHLERETLSRALADRPHGILVLGDGTLLHEADRRTVAAETTLVALERDLPNCYWRFQALARKDPSSDALWHPLFPDPLTSIDQVRPFYQERQPTLAAARHSYALAGESLGGVVNRLVGLLSAER